MWKTSDIKAIKDLSGGKAVIVKGVMNAEDAVEAVKLGADAIWVSNSGGRALDTLPSTISVIKKIAEATKKVNSQVDIYVDGGITRGTDVAKCLALGATMIMLGRPVAWSLHYGGKDGVAYMLSIL